MIDHNERERYRLETENDRLQRQNEALRDVARAAQLLIDVTNVTGSATTETLDNLKAALRAWYQPNGTGRD